MAGKSRLVPPFATHLRHHTNAAVVSLTCIDSKDFKGMYLLGITMGDNGIDMAQTVVMDV